MTHITQQQKMTKSETRRKDTCKVSLLQVSNFIIFKETHIKTLTYALI